MTRSAFHHEPRRSMSPQRRAKIFAERGKRCGWIKAGKQEGCGRPLGPADRWRVEHGDALENGGKDIDDNCGVSCSWCWPAKDAEDHKQAAKSRNTSTKHFVHSEDRRSSRGFRKAPPGYDSFNRRMKDE